MQKETRAFALLNGNSMETHTFWMPDYYPSFSCKMGACKNACCTGWPISFSLEDYFKLINENCSPSLRENLDRGIKICISPTPERYAEILPRYDGNCPMRLKDGRCALHAELGEKSLSDVCRLYPRGIRKESSGYEVSCANSCEAVLEQLLKHPEPITFAEKDLSILLPPLQKRSVFFETHGLEREIRLSLIRTMQNRAFPLPVRLLMLERRLASVEAIMKSGNVEALCEWLQKEKEQQVPPCMRRVSSKNLAQGLKTAEKLVSLIDERSVSIRRYGEEALSYFGNDEQFFKRYIKAEHRFENVFPGWSVFFENMLINHMFFTCFPFEDRPEDLLSEFRAICAVYTLLRFLSIGCSSERNQQQDYIEIYAAAFRLIDHTEFDIYVSHLLQDLGWTTEREITEWIIL